MQTYRRCFFKNTMKQFEIRHMELKEANSCSALYGACLQAPRALGHQRIITYTLEDEPGTSLRAAVWTFGYRTTGGAWSRAGRPRKTSEHEEPKQRYYCDFKKKKKEKINVEI